MSTTKNVLITGATGKQGGAAISALLNNPSFASSNIHIFAVTRSTTSKSALKLASNPSITLITGDLDDPRSIFSVAGPIWGVFSNPIAVPGTDSEERQGKALIDSAIVNGVKHFVYTSCDRGVNTDTNPTNVANMIAKFNIEQYLLKVAPPAGMAYTILRPVTFMENLTNDIHGTGFARMWEQMGSKKLQLVSTRDIGWFAAQALLFPEEERYHDAAISLAGDELTQVEAGVIFKEVVGKEMPLAPCLVGSALKMFMKEALGMMFAWLAEVGYAADVEECRRVYPEMMDFRSWLEKSSGFTKK